MHKKLLAGFVITGLVLFQTNSLAYGENQRNAEQIYKECGIGGVLLGNVSPIGAVISNVTWDLGTTALSSNVSSADTCIQSEVKTAAFIHNSYDSIIIDIAKGSGRYLETLANISGKSAANIRITVNELIGAGDYSLQTQTQRSVNLYNSII